MLLKLRGMTGDKDLEVEARSIFECDLDHVAPDFAGYSVSTHLAQCLHPLALVERVKRAVAALKHHDYDALACRGVSGIAYTIPLVMLTGKPPIVVRKPHEDSHGSKVEGFVVTKRYIIVDDFVSTGETAREIIKALRKYSYKGPECLGVLCVSKLPTVQKIEDCFKKTGQPWPLHTYGVTEPALEDDSPFNGYDGFIADSGTSTATNAREDVLFPKINKVSA